MSRHLAFALLIASLLGRTDACAPVMGTGQHVRVATESALIVWDEKTKTQHFIRRARFDTNVPYFGFLVPTPTQPELGEAPDELFTQLEDWTKPEWKKKTVYQQVRLLPWMDATLSAPLEGGVTVLDRQRVAGLDYAVLKATDAEGLRQWLEKHGYDARPALTAWLEPYVKAGWIITAFQIAKKEKGNDDVETKAVRMSFTAERPFFPYSEPPDQREGENVYQGRFLRVFCIASQRLQGTVDEPKKEWSGRAVWAGQLEGQRKAEVSEHLGHRSLPEGAWLTVFDDPAAPRPGTSDVFFSPSPEQSELRRPVIYEYQVIYYPATDLTVALALGAGLVGVWVFRKWHGRGRQPSA